MTFETVKFEDKGQDFNEWVIHNGFVVDCQPFQSRIWVGKEVMINGDVAYVRDGDEGVAINYLITSIEETDSAYVKGFSDSKSGEKDKSFVNNEQYDFGYNVGLNFEKVNASH